MAELRRSNDDIFINVYQVRLQFRLDTNSRRMYADTGLKSRRGIRASR